MEYCLKCMSSKEVYAIVVQSLLSPQTPSPGSRVPIISQQNPTQAKTRRT